MRRSRVTFATIEAAAIAALFVSPSTTAVCGGASGPSRKPSTRHASAGGWSSARTVRSPQEVRAVEPGAVDVGRRDHPHGDRGRGREDRVVEPLALLGIDLLRVVQERERPDAVAAKRCRSRAGRRRRRAAPRATPDPPRRRPRRTARRAAGRGEAVAVRSRAARPEDIPPPRTGPCRLRVDVHPLGRQHAAGVLGLESDPRRGRRSRSASARRGTSRSRPPTRRAAQMTTRACRSTNHGPRVPRAVDLVGVVRRVRGQARLGRLAGEPLRRDPPAPPQPVAKEPATANRRPDSQTPDARGVNLVGFAAERAITTGGARGSRAFLPTRPRR